MTAQFPYEKSFTKQLQANGKQPSTIEQYQLTLADFFNYEQHFNETFAKDQLLADLTENDVQTYLDMLQDQRSFKRSTMNKALSNLNGYFSYLFEHRIITTLPTFSIKGKALTNDQQLLRWPDQLPSLLQNDDLHVYTRAFLLFTCKGFTTAEMLAPDFEQQLNHITFSDSEQVFLEKLMTFLQPLRTSGQSGLFLKVRQRGQDAHLSLAALHKYLGGDSQRVGLPLKPVALRQSYVLWVLDQHRNTDPEILMRRLRLDDSSLAYYQNLLRRQDLRQFRNNPQS
ncbi:integrase [Lactiplantibacillus garii]|uniref:Integrase n=1 Tax=Lactiplantibacillus garii TaxID=2306423 RepID=A0A3R8J8S8_9LACO|nr:phage integrase N-terminal SAM-like domain-containing protein [Lactiplantibacillus garii]RRK10952.1 integrase [Lactiplantibacillus garii]